MEAFYYTKQSDKLFKYHILKDEILIAEVLVDAGCGKTFITSSRMTRITIFWRVPRHHFSFLRR
jgi:hypothetical protein